MKNQLSPPCFTTACPVACPNAKVSYVHCTPVGEQALPVRSLDPAADISSMRPA